MRDHRFIRAGLAGLAVMAACAGALVAGCNKTPEPEHTAPGAEPPGATTGAARPGDAAGTSAKPAPAGPSDLGWDAPAAWQKVENPNPMRKATYKIPKAQGDSEDAEMSVSQAGGSVEMNINRWAGQFQTKGPDAVKRTPRTPNGLNVTVVEIHGTFAGSGMPGSPAGEPKASYALLGAIVETAPGSGWFFKMTGPEKTVDGAKADFDKMVDSLRAK